MQAACINSHPAANSVGHRVPRRFLGHAVESPMATVAIGDSSATVALEHFVLPLASRLPLFRLSPAAPFAYPSAET